MLPPHDAAEQAAHRVEVSPHNLCQTDARSCVRFSLAYQETHHIFGLTEVHLLCFTSLPILNFSP